MTTAVVSLLYNVSYLPGALVLGSVLKTLIGSDNNIELALLVDKKVFSVHQLLLLNQTWTELIDVSLFESPLVEKLQYDLGRPELDKTFTKIQLWSLYDRYTKVLYLDVDTLPLVSAEGSVLDLLKLDFPVGKILAVPDSGFPDIFNSGVMVLKPHLNDYSTLLSLVKSKGASISFDGADQGLLNQYFNAQPDWVSDLLKAGKIHVADIGSKSSNWVPIPFFYNTTPSSQYEYLPAYKHFSEGPDQIEGPDQTDDELYLAFETLQRYSATARSFYNNGNGHIKLVHFIGPLKPWFSGPGSDLFSEWWDWWNKIFLGRSIIDVVSGEPEPVIPASPLQVPLIDDIVEEVVEDEKPFEPPFEPTISVPADLCDPKNYQHIQAPPATSADSAWDPSAEAPPVSTNTTNKDFEREWTFENAWDQPAPVRSQVEETPAVEPTDYTFGYHQAQVAERVFETPEYVPEHLLRKVERIEKEEQEEDEKEEEEEKELDEKEEKELQQPENSYQLASASSVDMDIVCERLDELTTEETKTPRQRDFAPLFPWEFRDDVEPERTFE